MNNNDYMTPQINELKVEPSTNPMKMKGLSRVVRSSYVEGMTSTELQLAIATAVQKQLIESAQTLDAQSARIVMDFLRSVDYGLVCEYDKEVRKQRAI